MSQPTKGTEIAALEARRNELEVRADGALLGERRAAIARLVLMVVLGIIQSTRTGHKNWLQFGVGAGYALWSLVTLLVLLRLPRAKPEHSMYVPIILTTVD